MGIPRLINIICHKALISAYGEGADKVTHTHVYIAVKDMEETKYSDQPKMKLRFQIWSRWLFGALGTIGLIVAGGFLNDIFGLFA